MIATTSSLSDILRNAPASVGVFHHHGLDYCCGGKTSLESACVEKGLDTQKVLSEIMAKADEDGPGTNLHLDLWDTAFLSQYIIENHHRYLRSVLPLACTQMAKVVSKHGEGFTESKAILQLIEELQSTLLIHLDEEETGLFATPASASQPQDIKTIVEKHEEDHEEVGQKLQRLRAITNDFTPPAGACTTHRAAYDTMRRIYEDTMQHVYLENAVLFPKMISDATISTSSHTSTAPHASTAPHTSTASPVGVACTIPLQ